MNANKDGNEEVGRVGEQAFDAPRESSKPLAEEGYSLMGAMFEVHRELGGGLLEEIYQQALEVEFELREIQCYQNT